MASTTEERFTEKSVVPGHLYEKVVNGKRTYLGEYVEFYVSQRNGCSIYDEPYYVFKKDGKQYNEALLDLQYDRAKLIDVTENKIETGALPSTQ